MKPKWKIEDKSWEKFRELLGGLERTYGEAPGRFLGRSDDLRVVIEEFVPAFLSLNAEINLTGIRESEEFLWKHFFDSLLVLKLRPRGLLLDWGSGGGFPGIPLVFFRKFVEKREDRMILLDGRRKKIQTVKSLLSSFGDFNVDFVHGRGEEFIQGYKVDGVLMRAVAPPKEILGWVTRQRADWFFFASKDQLSEWKTLEPQFGERGLRLLRILEEALPFSYGERKILHFSG